MKLWTNEKLLNVIEQLIGPDIGGHPVWNIRPKAPHESNHDVPWHQGVQKQLIFCARFN